MNFTRYRSAEKFLEENEAFLESEEVVNSLLLGLAIENKEKLNDSTFYINTYDCRGIHFAAIKTEGGHLIIYGNDTTADAYVLLLVNHIKQLKINVPGVIGPKGLALKIADAIKSEINCEYEIESKQLVYKLKKVKYDPEVKGKLKIATPDQIDKMASWMNNFQIEAFQTDQPNKSYEMAKNKIQKEQLFVWENGSEVAMGCIARPTKNGITINFVYTPVEFRKNGYGTKLVAELSNLMLYKGYRFCTLFTDLNNPTSNHIYKKIGYEPVCEFLSINFSY